MNLPTEPSTRPAPSVEMSTEMPAAASAASADPSPAGSSIAAPAAPAAPASIPAFAIGHITVRHAREWADYCSLVPSTLLPWGGSVVVRGQRLAVFNGEHPHTDTVVLRFPDAASALAWHASPAYQALIPLRDAAADVVLVAFGN